jgi:HlyD family secretion protein
MVAPSVSLAEVTLSEVHPGRVADTISATGTVIPVHEESVASPAATRIVKVVARPGKQVAAGELLLALDDKELRLAIDTLKEQLAQQENRVAALTLELAQKRKQLQSAIELLELDLRSAQAKWKRYSALRDSGAVSGEDLLSAELNVTRVQVQLRQQHEQIEDARKSTSTAIEGARLQKAILEKQLAQQQLQLELAQVRAPFSGVLTWVNEDEGASVAAGQAVARVSDMQNYRVEATLSDFHAHRVAAGQAARIEQGGVTLLGHVQTVLPEIKDGTMKVLVALDQPHHPQLRNKLRVDVAIVTEGATDGLVAITGPAINGRGQQQLFVVRGGTAQRTSVEIGAGDGHVVQIASGARAGDRIIVSDMKRFDGIDTIRIHQ